MQSAEPSSLEPPSGQPDAAWLRVTLNELVSFGETLDLRETLRDLRAARERLLSQRFNLVVLGEFKRGKSTLINALLERDLLPTGVLPLTSVVTIISAGEEPRLLVSLADEDEFQAPLDELPEYVTEAGNPENRLGVRQVRIELSHELLDAGVDLVDTPGVGSIHQHNTTTARDFLAQVDAAVFVLDAGQPFTAAEQDLVREVAQRAPRVLLVLNKIDQLIGGDRQTALEFIEHAAGELLGSERDAVFPISAREGEGVAALRRRLRRLATRERMGTLTRSLAGIAAAAAAELIVAARLERRARELPLNELRQRISVFQTRILELQSAGDDAATLLQQGVRRALAEHLDQPLQSWARAESQRLTQALRMYAIEQSQLSLADLANDLARWIDARIRVELADLASEYEPALASELVALQDGYAARIARILDEVHALAADVFDTQPLGLLPRVGLREQSRFSFKLDDPHNPLELVLGRLRTLMPGRIGRRMLIADAEERLVAMADRHAGRLRSELHERVTHTTRSYVQDLAANVEQAIAAMTQALERAASQHTTDQAAARVRLTELTWIVERCELIAELGVAS